MCAILKVLPDPTRLLKDLDCFALNKKDALLMPASVEVFNLQNKNKFEIIAFLDLAVVKIDGSIYFNMSF